MLTSVVGSLAQAMLFIPSFNVCAPLFICMPLLTTLINGGIYSRHFRDTITVPIKGSDIISELYIHVACILLYVARTMHNVLIKGNPPPPPPF